MRRRMSRRRNIVRAARDFAALLHEPGSAGDRRQVLCSGNRDLLERLRQQGMSYARERLTWEAKAQDVTKVLHWVLWGGAKPDFLPPKPLPDGVGSSR